MGMFRFQVPRRGGRRAFTLIELLVVVVIVGVIFSIVLPALLRAGRARPAEPPAAARPADGDAVARRPPPGPPGTWPVLDAADVALDLEVTHQRIGLEVYTRTLARAEARYVVRAAAPGPVRLEVPFPAGTVEARDVALRMETPTGTAELPGVRFGPGGMSWTGVLPRDPLVVHAAYTTRSGETFEYRLPSAARTRAAAIDVAIAGEPRFTVPDRSLQPTSVEGARLAWRVRDLVADRPVVIALPAADSPLGRAARLFQLAGLALLAFGAGFWYLGDLRSPGALDDFRWGHFLLLALTYCTFFVAFAVLGFHGQVPTGWALAASAAVSLPLLLLQASRIRGARFALRDALPLAAGSVGLAIAGVYGEAWRDYVFLAAGLAAMAYVTATYPAWAAGREAQAERRLAAARAAEAAEDLPMAGAGGKGLHCVACGAAGGEAPFCAACGTPRARDLGCPRCGAAVSVPAPFLAASYAPAAPFGAGAFAARLHCRCCGAGLVEDPVAG